MKAKWTYRYNVQAGTISLHRPDGRIVGFAFTEDDAQTIIDGLNKDPDETLVEKWVSIEDRLPEFSKECYVIEIEHGLPRANVAYRVESGMHHWLDRSGNFLAVTHWKYPPTEIFSALLTRQPK